MTFWKWDEILTQFTHLYRDKLAMINKEEMTTFCVENKAIREIAEDYLKNIPRSDVKDSNVASQKKEEGNKKYLEREFEESLRLYTESIFNANKEDKCLSLAYGNRSLVLELMNYPSESLVDIEMALNNGYPENKSQKLMLRKARCLVKLGDIEKAREVLITALKNVNKKEHRKMFADELSKLKNLKNPKGCRSEYKLPKLSGGENKNFASASAHISVYFNETMGRHVIATENIQMGEALFVEKAFAFVVHEEACHHCLKRTIAPIPCNNCLDVMYCSSKCRDDDWKPVHSFLCGFGKSLKSLGVAYLSLQIIITASSTLKELKNLLSNINEPKYENGVVAYRSKDYESVYNLVHHSDKQEIDNLFQYVLTALLLAIYMKNNTNYFPDKSGDEDLKLLTSVIFRHILQIICNGQVITETFVLNEKEALVLNSRDHAIGAAIYPSASMMNHSCEPSVIISFYKNYMIVLAAKEIKKGEEVFNCYGVDARRNRKSFRQEILRKQYFFDCKCHACLQAFD